MYHWYHPFRRMYERIEVYEEVRDLLISWAALSIAFAAESILRGELQGLLLSCIAVATAFVFHELAHRQVARRYRLYARYKAWYTGLALAVIIAFLTAKIFNTAFILAAPGAVYIYAYMGIPPPDIEYKVAIAGPLTNALLGAALLIASYFTGYPWASYLRFIGNVNAWLAVFNLLPLPPLDGSKVIRYSVSRWLIAMLFSLVVFFVL